MLRSLFRCFPFHTKKRQGAKRLASVAAFPCPARKRRKLDFLAFANSPEGVVSRPSQCSVSVAPAELQDTGNSKKDAPGYLYLLKEREFRKTNEPIFKIGRTETWRVRFTKYPKDSLVFTFAYVDNVIQKEDELKALFDSRFIQRKDIGRESYEGDKREIIEAFLDFVVPLVKSSEFPEESLPIGNLQET